MELTVRSHPVVGADRILQAEMSHLREEPVKGSTYRPTVESMRRGVYRQATGRVAGEFTILLWQTLISDTWGYTVDMLQKTYLNAIAASNIVLRDHLSDLTGLGPEKLKQLESKYPHADPDTNPLTLAGVLREREDGLLALHWRVRRLISRPYVDRFLEDAVEILGVAGENAGYYHSKFNLRGDEYGGACGIEGVKPPVAFQPAFRDAMADLRGHNVVTNIGQSGCCSCGRAAIGNLVDELEEGGTDVLGYVSFSAQHDPDNPYIGYTSLDAGTLSTEEVGDLVASSLEQHGISYNWDEDDDVAVEAKL